MKMRSVFDKLIPKKNKKFKKNNVNITKFFKPGRKIYFEEYKNGKLARNEILLKNELEH